MGSSTHGLLFIEAVGEVLRLFCFTVRTEQSCPYFFGSWQGKDDYIREVGIEKANRGTDYI